MEGLNSVVKVAKGEKSPVCVSVEEALLTFDSAQGQLDPEDVLNKLMSNKQKVNGSNKDSEHRSVHGAKRCTGQSAVREYGEGAESKWQNPRAPHVSLVSTAGSFEGTGTPLLVRFHQPV